MSYSKKFVLKQLNSKHYKCIELLVYNELSQEEIAKILKVSDQSISNWKKSDLFMNAYDEELKKSKINRNREYGRFANKAARKLNALMTCGNPKIELDAAKEIIKLAGDEPDTNIQIEIEDDGFIEALNAKVGELDWSDEDEA